MAEKESAVETDLPKAAIKRLAKAKIDSLGEGNVQLHKDATLALAESAKVLIAFFTATANDICKEKKRQTISADDVLQALEEVDFTDLVAPLQVALDGEEGGSHAAVLPFSVLAAVYAHMGAAVNSCVICESDALPADSA